MSRNAQDVEFEEEEWDPQGLNTIGKEELESFGIKEDEEDVEDEDAVEEDPIVEEDAEEEQDGEENRAVDLNYDGLKELEDMERSLRQEESFDFVLISEEE